MSYTSSPARTMPGARAELLADASMSPARRLRAACAALLALLVPALTTATVTGSLPVGLAVADSVAAAVGAAAALVQGADASDRRGRRRFVLLGLVLLAAAVAVHALAVPIASGLLLGIGAVLVATAAAGWLKDCGLPSPVAVVLAGSFTFAGLLVPTEPAWIAGLLAAAVLAVALAPETVRGARTPVFVLPSAPRLGHRPAAVPVLVVLAAALALRNLGLIPGVTVLAVVTLAVAAAARLARVHPAPAPLQAEGGAYRRAVAVFDRTTPPRPALAATVSTVEQIRDALHVAGARGLGVAVHSTGHAAAGLADLAGSALLKVRIDEPITVDRERGTVRVPAGRTWGDVVDVLAPYGLTVPHGSSGRVGVVGYLTRGGLSAYGRHTGVAANWVESFELVSADGRHLVVDRSHDPELFWALRGGGGGFGIVTAVTIRTFAPGTVVTGTVLWEVSDADAVAQEWAAWTAEAPSAITTSLRILTIPPLPGMPMRLTRRPLLVVDGTAVDGDVPAREAAGSLLSRLRGAAAPRLDTWRVAGVTEVPNTHMDPPFSAAHSTAHALLGAGGAADVDQARSLVADFVRAASDSGVSISELRQLGGALGSAPEGAGTVGHYRGAFGWVNLALHGKPGREAAETSIDLQWSALAEWATGYTAPTLAVERQRPARSFPEQEAGAVDAVRERVDPLGLFRVDIAPGAQSRRG